MRLRRIFPPEKLSVIDREVCDVDIACHPSHSPSTTAIGLCDCDCRTSILTIGAAYNRQTPVRSCNTMGSWVPLQPFQSERLLRDEVMSKASPQTVTPDSPEVIVLRRCKGKLAVASRPSKLFVPSPVRDSCQEYPGTC